MRHITFYLDFISPFSYLAFEKLPETLKGLSYEVRYRPVLLGALLRHHGLMGPAEVAAKREWTYRHVLWLGHQHQLPMQMPAVHPFNPLPLLRLAIACASAEDPNRYVCETLLRYVWRDGAAVEDEARMHELREKLSPAMSPDDAAVKTRLRENTDQALGAGVFGVPAFEVDGRLFWGFDSLPMLRSYLDGETWFDGPGWSEASERPSALK